MIKAVLPALAVASFMVSGPAVAAEYYCTFKGQPTRSLIPPDLLITVDLDAGSAQVIDGMIESRVGEPLTATIVDANDTRVLVAWRVPGERNAVGQFTHAFRYRLNLMPARGQAQMTGAVEGYSNHENVKGACERRK